MKAKSLFLTIIFISSLMFMGCKSHDESKAIPDFTEQTETSAQECSEEAYEELPTEAKNQPLDITLAFAGDLSLADNYVVMDYYHNEAGDDLANCIDSAYIKRMNDADVMWINNEFCYSNQGSPIPGKAYTFCAAPENVNILKELGVDIVGLANNHVYDFGPEAFADTLATLRGAEIAYVGAGADIKEASAPVYVDVDGYKIAYVAATRAEKNIKTPEATETSGGVFRCYDNTDYIEKIKEAKANADYVIALPHWGAEHSTILEAAQTDGAKEYIDAGADAVIGAHTHCLQGMDFYNGKPIIYSLGNFWFDDYTLDTMLLELHLTGTTDHVQVTVEMVPGTQSERVTRMSSTVQERNRIYAYMESISSNIGITPATEEDNGGIVFPVTK
ncbi:MAG: CapA family protein [Agathobacter sp.]|nr:CapA family protein [Agathobacter sp.]MDY3888790.1 CapA family protein [Agathobacter sp.]